MVELLLVGCLLNVETCSYGRAIVVGWWVGYLGDV